jgi:hypothetical protein
MPAARLRSIRWSIVACGFSFAFAVMCGLACVWFALEMSHLMYQLDRQNKRIDDTRELILEWAPPWAKSVIRSKMTAQNGKP